MFKSRMAHLSYLCAILGLLALIAAIPAQALPPYCPHVLGWGGSVQSWCNGAPWIKVLSASEIATAKACGAQVFYRPYDTSVGTDDGDLPGTLTGTTYADAVWAKISGLSQKPEAVGYRNEFGWTGNSSNRYNAAQFRSYRDRLRALGYTGMVVFGSFPTGVPDSYVWDEPEVADAASCADAIETHEYFDLTVNCIYPYLTFRHKELAIATHPTLLGSKPWFIGEFGSDNLCGASGACGDAQCRQGWNSSGKLSETAYKNEMITYRANCSPNILAIFVFQQGSAGWTGFETINSGTISDYIKSTWTVTTGTITGTVKDGSNNAISGVTVSTNVGGYTTTTNASGVYTLSNVNTGTYNVTASKSGYNPVTNTGVVVTSGGTATSNFTLTAASPGSITGYVKDLSGVAISGATVSTNTGGYTTTTAADGTYTLSTVAAGTYNVTASKTNYNNLTNNGVAVTGGQATTSNFNLQNAMNTNTPTGTNNAPQSTTVNADTVIGSGFEATKAVDASTTTKWCTTNASSTHWLALDLGQNRTVNGFVIKFPGGCGELQSYNAKNFSIQSASSLAGPWSDEVVVDNTAQANTVSRSYVVARTLRYVRLNITNPGIDNYTRLYEFEVWCASCTLPSITTQPQNSTVCAGSNASFSVTATNATGYQWRKASVNISGATTSAYSKTGVVTGDAGSYDCVVSNACGNVTSSAATLTVNSVPSITTQPQSQTKNVGQSVTFSVTATGATSYQWRKASANISGATTSAYTIASVATGDAANYDVIVTNSCGSVTSSAATLTVTTYGSITGYVKTLTGDAISGATVSTNTGGYTTTTAADGTYTLANVAAATYNVTASKTGYVSKTNNGVVVTSGNAATSNFNLQNTMNTNTPTGTNRAPASTTVNVDTYYGAGTEGTKAVDANMSTKWCTTGVVATHWLSLDLGANRTVNGFVVKLAGAGGEYTTMNFKNFQIQSATSLSGPWYDEVVVDNTAQANTVSRSYDVARNLRYVRLYITNPGIDNYARLYELEVWAQ